MKPCPFCSGVGRHFYYCRTSGTMTVEQAAAHVADNLSNERNRIAPPAGAWEAPAWRDASDVVLLPSSEWACGGDPDCVICKGLDQMYDVRPALHPSDR